MSTLNIFTDLSSKYRLLGIQSKPRYSISFDVLYFTLASLFIIAFLHSRPTGTYVYMLILEGPLPVNNETIRPNMLVFSLKNISFNYGNFLLPMLCSIAMVVCVRAQASSALR